MNYLLLSLTLLLHDWIDVFSILQAKNMDEMNAVLEDARRKLSERINSELELAEDRRNKQLGGLLDRIKEHVCTSYQY